MIDAFLLDLRAALRGIRRNPGVAAAAVLTFALGIGLNSAIFSIINPLMFRPLPVPEADRLVVIGQLDERVGFPVEVDYQDMLALRDRTGAFAEVAGHVTRTMDLGGEGLAERVWVQEATANLFEALGLSAALGRTFIEGDDRAALANPVVVLSHDFWRRRFAGDPGVIGRAIRLNGSPATVMGVLPEGFRGLRAPMSIDAFVPLNQIAPGWGGSLAQRGGASFDVVARLRSGITLESARAEADAVSSQLAGEFPQTNRGRSFVVRPETKSRPAIAVAATTQRTGGIFLGLVSLVLVIACANVSNLMLARITARSRELAIRAALGASRTRLASQAITETLVLATIGSLAALFLAAWATRALGRVNLAVDAPVHARFPLDWRVFAFTLALATLAGLLAGLIPALHSTRARPGSALKQGERAVSGRAQARVLATMVALQIAVSVIVLVSAALVARSVRGASRIDLGFEPRNLLMFSADLSNQGYDSEQRQRFHAEVLARLRSTPGVLSASLARNVPFGYSNNGSDVFPEGSVDEASRSFIFYNAVSADYFRTMRIPLLHGRDFASFDDAAAPRVAIVNEVMAQTLWPGAEAVGRRFRMGADGQLLEVVGVVASSRFYALGGPPGPFFYLPTTQNAISIATFHVRTAGDPTALAPLARQIVHAIDNQLPVFDVRDMKEHLERGRAIGLLRIGGWIAAMFGLLAVAITVVGINGVVGYATVQRQREIALRMAVGAQRADIRRLILGHALVIALVGVTVGLVGALGFARPLSSMLYGVSPTDPSSLGGTAALLIALALLASLAPLRRALRVQPMAALNAE